MSQRRDRHQLGRHGTGPPSRPKDEPDASTLRSGSHASFKVDMSDRNDHLSRASEAGQRFSSVRESVRLAPEAGSGGAAHGCHDDSKSSVTDLLYELKAKVEATNAGDSDLHAEIQKLIEATIKQKEEFNQLYETVKRQNLTIRQFEQLISNKKLPSLGQAEGTVAPLSSATQCTQDLEEFSGKVDRTVVFLIRGNCEFPRTISQCGATGDLLNSVYIPEVVNTGNRMVAGQREFPHLLLQSSAVDAWVDLQRTSQTPTRQNVGVISSFVEHGGVPDRVCPVCSLTFTTMDALVEHVDRHWNENDNRP